MSIWNGTAQAYLDGGGIPVFRVALYLSARRFDTGELVDLAYWTAEDDYTLLVGDTQRDYQGVGEALSVPAISEAVGTTLSTARATMFGLDEEGKALYQSLNVEQAPASIHHVMLNTGNVVLGTCEVISGVVDSSDLNVSASGSDGEVVLEISRRMQAGTRVNQAKKSHASYQRRNGDTSMKYASLQAEEGDTWI